MRQYQSRMVTVLAACTCDRCGRRMSRDEPDEWQERLSILTRERVVQSRKPIAIDLCQHCVREVRTCKIRHNSAFTCDSLAQFPQLEDFDPVDG